MKQIIICNECHRPMLEKHIGHRSPSPAEMGSPTSIYGFDLYYNESMPKWATGWIPPEAERFVEYGPEDESWARPLGLGHIGELVGQPLFMMLGKPHLRLSNFLKDIQLADKDNC